MKANFVSALLVFCICAGAADLPERGSSTSLRKLKGLGAITSKSNNTSLLKSAQGKNASNPYLKIAFGYKRAATVAALHKGLSFDECCQFCRNHSSRCVAVNYQRYSWFCEELEELGDIRIDSHYATKLVNFDGNDPCDERYFLKGCYMAGFDRLTIYGSRVGSAKECCIKCKDDPTKSCKAWDYETSTKNCILQVMGGPLHCPAQDVSGFGVLDYSSVKE